jgi:hypothetical protein
MRFVALKGLFGHKIFILKINKYNSLKPMAPI